MRKGFASGSQHDLPQHVCWRPVECTEVQTAHGRAVGGLFVFAHAEQATQNLRRRSCSRTGEPGWGPLIVPLPPSLLTASSFFLVHSSPSVGRRGAVAAEVMNALATWWRRNNERNVNSHWTDPLIQISILGPCGCCGEISSNIACFPPDALITCSTAFTEARS